RKSRDSANTTLYKAFPGGLLALVGANSGAGLRSMPAGRIALDEVDAYPLDVDGEGDPVELAKRALRSYGRRAKGLYVSTPTIAGRSRIEREYLLGDQSEYHVPCPHCEHLQTLAWPRMEWDDDDPEHVWMRCEACDERIEEHHKPQILADGVWVPKYPERSSSIRSFKLPGLYAPLGMYSWAESARKFRKGKKDPAVLRVWTNHDLAETWTEKGELPEWEELYRRRERTEPGRVPEGGLVLTAGADVQANRIEVEIVAWGEGMQSWSVDYVVIPGNPAEREVWSDLQGLLEHPWPSSLGIPLRVERLAIDSGYATQYVYAWARAQSARRVMVVRGDDRPGVLLSSPQAVEVNESGRRLKRGVQLWKVGAGLAKEELYGWLRQKPSLHPEEDGWPRGWCHLPDREEEWYRQLCSEQLVNRVVNGKRRYLWEKVRERNEALDCRVYARAAAAQIGIDRWGDAEWKAHRERMAQLASPVETPKRQGQRADNFLDRWGD
ncbi:MAG: terminase gpA endonuclease subunit, partial [Planctomycetota bacterium]